MKTPSKSFAALFLGCVICLGLIALDASRLRRERASLADDTTRVLGLSDLALSSTARWLRHPSQAEPAAGTADGPLALDVEPAGALLRPPRATAARTERAIRVDRR